MVGVVGATGNNANQCDVIYQKNSKSYDSCIKNLTKATVKVVCVNNVYVINNDSQNAGTGGSVTVNGNSISGSATNQSGATVNIGASCGKVTGSASSTTPSQPGGSTSSSTTPKTPSSTSSSTAMAAASLPETGSNTVLNAAIAGTALIVGGLVISFVGTALYRRAALK